jgi:arabinofuranan 3-O-arabinosyltransferase
VIRLPLVLGLAHLLGRIPLPGCTPRKEWMHAFAHPEHDKRVAIGIVVLVALAASSSLAWTGRLTPPGAFDAIPPYWHQTADWLDAHNAGSPTGRVLVVPGAPFATQVWGTSHDEPLQVLGNSPWGVRDSIPLTPPQTIRALDSVQRLLAAGRPSAGLADTLVRQGISYVVVRNDLDPESSRSARPVLVHKAIEGSGGLTKGRGIRRTGRTGHACGLHHRQRASAEISGGADLPGCRRYRGGRAVISPTPTPWPASTAAPRRYCGSTSGAGC